MSKILQKKFFEEITFFGGIAFYLFLIILFLILNKPSYSVKIILGLIIIYFSTFVIRIFYFKQRPNKIPHTNFVEKIDASSFPSIHAARITFLSLFAILLFNLPWLISCLVILTWLLVIYSRIYLKKHDVVDVITGIVLGIFALISLILV